MSQSTPTCFPFCSKCKRKSAQSIHHYDRDHHRTYLDVRAIEPRGEMGVLFRCNVCQHEWVSSSAAGRRARRRFDANAAPTENKGC